MRRIILLATAAVVMAAMMAFSGVAWATPASENAPQEAQQQAQCKSGGQVPVFPGAGEIVICPKG
jgi:hypothetical protein